MTPAVPSLCALSLFAALLMNSVSRSTRSAGGAAAAGFVKPSGTNCLGTRQPYKSPLIFFLPAHLVEGVLLCAAAPAQMVLGGSFQGSLSGFKSRISGVLKGLLFFFLPPSPACHPSPRVPAGFISSSSKSMAVPRGGNSIFPFPLKMEEQLLAYEQRYPSLCFPSSTAFSPPPSLQQQPGSSCTELFPAEQRGFSVELPQHRLQENGRVKQSLPEVLTVSSDRLPPPPVTAPHPGEHFGLDLFILGYISYRHSWICWEEAFAGMSANKDWCSDAGSRWGVCCYLHSSTGDTKIATK